MSNDIFVREVNEELRQDRAKALWIRYGAIAVGLAVLIVLGVGGYVLWERYQAGLEAADGDRLIAASALIAENKDDEARTILGALITNGTGAYPDLARLRMAEMAQDGDPAAAVTRFDEVANDASAPQGLRDMAAIRAAYILVDSGSLADVRQRVERLTGDGEALRYPAREAVGLAAWKGGDIDTAKSLFTQLQDDLGTPQGIKRRATVLLEMIAASTPAPSAGNAAPPEEASEMQETATPPAMTPPAAPAPAAPVTSPTPEASITPPAVIAPSSAMPTPPTSAAPAAPISPAVPPSNSAPSQTPAAPVQPPA